MENTDGNFESNNKQSNAGLKAIIAILALLLLGSVAYIYKITDDSKQVEVKLLTEKESVLKDLTEAKDSLNAAISTSTTLSEELIAERDKVERLMIEVKSAKDDAESMKKYVYETKRLKETVGKLMAEVNTLKSQNQRLTVERDSTANVLGDSRRINDTLTSQNSKLATVVEKASKLTVLNLQTSAVKQKSSGKQVSTDKASKADVLKISFTIAENVVAKSGDKTYFVQIIDPKNNVIGEQKTQMFGEKSLIYSFSTSVKYENKTVQISKDLDVKDIVEGSYFVNIFDKGDLVSKTSFTLK